MKIKLISFETRETLDRPQLASPSNVRNGSFPTTLPLKEKARKEIARNVCEKVQSWIPHLAFQVSKRWSMEKSTSCAIAFSRAFNSLPANRLDKCNEKYRAIHLAFKIPRC
ncbi:hypothetical protein ACS0PU_005187 [Formica fusca]